MIYANANTYDGEWSSDMKQGSGKLIFANGDVYNGKWKKDFKKEG